MLILENTYKAQPVHLSIGAENYFIGLSVTHKGCIKTSVDISIYCNVHCFKLESDPKL